MKCQ